MERIPQEKQRENILNNFKRKIADLKKDPGESFPLIDVNPEELTKEDMDMYGKYADGTVTLEEFRSYQNKFFALEGGSRKNFAAYLGNKVGGFLLKKHIEEEKAG